MSDLSPQCAIKRTSVNAMNLLVHARVQLEVRRPGPCRLPAQPSSILVPLNGRAALNIRIKPNNISRAQPGQQAQVSLKGGRADGDQPATQAGFGRENFRAVRAEGWGDRRGRSRLRRGEGRTISALKEKRRMGGASAETSGSRETG